MKEYKLASYARLVSSPSGAAWDDCGTSSSSAAALKLNLLEVGFLVISAGARELEALCVSPDRQQDLRAVYRDKHVLFLQRVGDQFRRFRVKFAHRAEAADCVREIAKKLRVKGAESLQLVRKGHADTGGDAGKVVVLRGDVSVSDLAAAVLEPQNFQLPAGYSAAASSMSSEEMEEAIRLHLMDASFPGFVETVEQLIRQMTTS